MPNESSSRRRRAMLRRRAGAFLTGLTASTLGYWFLVRPRLAAWGARPEETALLLPGDELVPRPRYVANHAIDVAAPPADIWPWIVQIGQDRAGFYSFTWIEDLLGLDIRNADRIVAAWQTLRAGDRVRLDPEGALTMEVAVVEPERALVLYGGGDEGLGLPTCTWAFHLLPSEHGTRLLARFRADYRPTLRQSLAMQMALPVGHLIMEWQMLRTIRKRVEAALRLQRAVYAGGDGHPTAATPAQ